MCVLVFTKASHTHSMEMIRAGKVRKSSPLIVYVRIAKESKGK